MMEEQKPLETQAESSAATSAAPEQLGNEEESQPTQEPLTETAGQASPQPAKAAESPAAEATAIPEESPPPEQVIAVLKQEKEVLQRQLAEQMQQVDVLKNRYISQAAEFDNFRKRTAKEKEDLEGQVKCRTLSELLPIVDNFERARTQIKPANDGELAIHKSYQGVYKSLVENLKRLGVSAMRPEGQPFDPAYHEAMLREQTDEFPEGTVIEQLIRGYMLGEQVLRHAMVKVAAPKETAIPSGEETAGGEEENKEQAN